MQRIIKDYYEQIHASKLDNLEKMNTFLERYNLLILNQKEIESLDRPILLREIELVIETPQKTKSKLIKVQPKYA